MAAMMKDKSEKEKKENNAKNAKNKTDKDSKQKQDKDNKGGKKEDKKEDRNEDRKEDKKEEKKGEKNNEKKENFQKEGGEVEYDGGDEEKGKKGPGYGTKGPAYNARGAPALNAKGASQGAARDRAASGRDVGREMERRAGQDRALDEVDQDYLNWTKRNNDSISKIIVTTFPKYFLFFAFCVGFCASRAPTDFAVGLTFSMVLVRIVHVYAYYYFNQILIIG
jgi:hypothetical protein